MKVEARIQELCARAIAEQDPVQLEVILAELRKAVQEHCDYLRILLSEYPLDLPSLERFRDVLLADRTTQDEMNPPPGKRRRAA